MLCDSDEEENREIGDTGSPDQPHTGKQKYLKPKQPDLWSATDAHAYKDTVLVPDKSNTTHESSVDAALMFPSQGIIRQLMFPILRLQLCNGMHKRVVVADADAKRQCASINHSFAQTSYKHPFDMYNLMFALNIFCFDYGHYTTAAASDKYAPLTNLIMLNKHINEQMRGPDGSDNILIKSLTGINSVYYGSCMPIDTDRLWWENQLIYLRPDHFPGIYRSYYDEETGRKLGSVAVFRRGSINISGMRSDADLNIILTKLAPELLPYVDYDQPVCMQEALNETNPSEEAIRKIYDEEDEEEDEQ